MGSLRRSTLWDSSGPEYLNSQTVKVLLDLRVVSRGHSPRLESKFQKGTTLKMDYVFDLGDESCPAGVKREIGLGLIDASVSASVWEWPKEPVDPRFFKVIFLEFDAHSSDQYYDLVGRTRQIRGDLERAGWNAKRVQRE